MPIAAAVPGARPHPTRADDDPDCRDSSSSVGAAAHSHRDDSYHDDVEDDDNNTQYYETGDSFTHASTTHFGGSAPAEHMDLSGYGNFFGAHSGTPPMHQMMNVILGATAPGTPGLLPEFGTSLPQHLNVNAAPFPPLGATPDVPLPLGNAVAPPSPSDTATPSVTTEPLPPPLSVMVGNHKAGAVQRTPSEEHRALELRQSQRRVKIGVRYKTKHCHSFMESGECRYGDSCVFAHGDEELAKYLAIAEAAEAAATATDAAPPTGDRAHTKGDPKGSGAVVTPTSSIAIPAPRKASNVLPAPTGESSLAPVVAPPVVSKYKDALMKSNDLVKPTTTATTAIAKPSAATVERHPTAARSAEPIKVAPLSGRISPASSVSPPVSPHSALGRHNSGSPTFNSKLTALHLQTHLANQTPAKRCADYGFGASVSEERNRATEGNRRVPQEELERYRLERKAEAIARARMSEASSSPSASPLPEGLGNEAANDFFARQPPMMHHERSMSYPSLSENIHESCAAAVLMGVDSTVGTPVTDGKNASSYPAGTRNFATMSNASSSTSQNYYSAHPPHNSGWEFLQQSQQRRASAADHQGYRTTVSPSNSTSAVPDSPTSAQRYRHNPYGPRF